MYGNQDLYEIPRRLDKKEGMFGSVQTIDVVCTLSLVLAGLIFMMAINSFGGNTYIGIIIFGLSMGSSYVFFIWRDRYEENGRIKIKRWLDFRKSQRLFYYFRGTGKPYIK